MGDTDDKSETVSFKKWDTLKIIIIIILTSIIRISNETALLERRIDVTYFLKKKKWLEGDQLKYPCLLKGYACLIILIQLDPPINLVENTNI